MGVNELYPEPPHLSLSLYGGRGLDVATFSGWCTVLSAQGAESIGLTEVAPVGYEFDLFADLAMVKERRQLSSQQLRALLLGEEVNVRVVRTGFTVRPVGLVVVTYELRNGVDSHPVAVLSASGPLGLPVQLWSSDDRRKAKRIVKWAVLTFRAACAELRPLYGGINVEQTLPTPTRLISGESQLGSEVFISNQLLEVRSSLRQAVSDSESMYEVAEWEDGFFLASWSPFVNKEFDKEPSDSFKEHFSREVAHAVRRVESAGS